MVCKKLLNQRGHQLPLIESFQKVQGGVQMIYINKRIRRLIAVL